MVEANSHNCKVIIVCRPYQCSVSLFIKMRSCSSLFTNHINVLFPPGRSDKSQQSNVIDQGGVVEVWVDLEESESEYWIWKKVKVKTGSGRK